MGMYTEIYINVNLKENIPVEDEVIKVLLAMKNFDTDSIEQLNKPSRWGSLFSSEGYSTPNTSCACFDFDMYSNQWSLLGKGDIKNYGGEIQQFFDWIKPYVDGLEGDFIGYMRYEDDLEPNLIYL